MIDINELRRLAQAATPGPWEVAYTDQNGQAVIKGKHIEIATCWHHCAGSIEKEMYANAALIAAANPAAISELLDRLEAAEKERDALRAKIEQMEEQEPSAPEFCPCCGNIMRACMICPNEDCNAVTATAEQSKYNKQHALARKASGAAAPEAKP